MSQRVGGAGSARASASARDSVAGPPPPPRPAQHLPGVLAATAARRPDAPLVARRNGTGWTDLSAAQFAAHVDAVARGLVAAGISAGDRIALLARTRYEWTLCDMAILGVGAVTVPIYETSSPEQVAWILSDSGAAACFVDSRAQLAAVRAAVPNLPVWSLEAVAGVEGLAALEAGGRDVRPEAVQERLAALGPDSLATIIYTSGTTGRPKGCELTHGNFLAECSAALVQLPELFEREDASTLHFLPLAHVFGRMIQFACLLGGVHAGHSDLARITKDLATFRPTFLLAVPRVFEKVYETAARKAAADGRGRVFELAVSTAVAASIARDSRRPHPLLAARRAVFDRLVYAKLRAAFGGRVEWAVSGGAPLGARLAHFFRGAGITVLEGYGLTETTAATTVNNRAKMRIGTVGHPLPGMEVRIAPDGEVQVRGGHVFAGYWANPDASAEVRTDDGWFRTGDLGSIDADGFLAITGRSKEILVTAAGKNVAPAALEDLVRSCRFVSQCMLVGDGRAYVAALVTLDEDAVRQWSSVEASDEPAGDNPVVRADIQAAIDAANATVSPAEAITRFAVLPGDFTEANGQLTPTMKLRRPVILAEHADAVEALYAGRGPAAP